MARKKTNASRKWYSMDLHLHTPASSDYKTSGISYLDRSSGNGTTLSNIVGDLTGASGLTSADVDVTDLVDTTVKGYIVSRLSTAKSALQPLAQAYFFDAVESGYKVKFVDRGGAVVQTILQNDLAALSSNDFWIQERKQDQELPMRISVSYMDFDRDYQQGTQYTKRSESPFPVMYSKNQINVPLAIVLDDSEAKQISEKLLYNTWSQRDVYTFSLPWKYIHLDPTDIIDVTLDNGVTFNVRIATFEIGADFSIQVSAVSEEVTNYTSVAVAENNFEASIIGGSSARSFLVVHNVPLLADTHDQGRLKGVLYIQAGPLITGGDWTGCTLYKSTDQITWEAVTRVVDELTYGSVQQILGPPADVFAVDVINTLTIWPIVGGPNFESITYAQLLAGANNMMIVGDEVINFQNVTDNGDGSYTIDTFLRGRRGTDTVADSHTAGENFYLISTSNAEALTIALSEINSPLYFRAVGSGEALEEADVVIITPTGEDLKPYAPINATRADNSPSAGDITIGWDRRTRINGETVGVVPLNEDSESYEVDILDTSGGTVLRTLVSAVESVEYDTADITTDFGSVPTVLYVRIYQLSAQIGRGKSYEFALE